MKQIEVTDAWLYKYMPVVDEAIITEIEKRIDYEYTFSLQFDREMAKLIRKEKFVPFWNTFAKIGKRVAIFVFIFLCSAFTVTMSVKAYRLHFFETVKKIWTDTVLYTYFTEENDSDFKKYELNYLPDGYSLVEEIGNDNSRTATYRNSDGKEFVIDQFLVSDNRTIALDSEYSKETTAVIDGRQLYIYSYDDGLVSAYYEYKNSVFILSADNLSEKEIVSIFENID